MKIAAEFTIKHVNNRREKAGEGLGPMASDIKLETEVTDEDVKELFSTSSSFDRLLGTLWNEENELTTSDLKKLTLAHEGVGCNVRFVPEFSEPLTLESADVNSIILCPLPARRVKVTMRVQSRTSKEQRGQLSEWQECSLIVNIASRQGELPLAAETSGKDTLDVQEGAENMLPVPDLTTEADDKPKVEVIGQKPPQRPRKSKSSSAAATH